MSTPELKPETPLTDAMVAAYRKEGLETYASTCAAIALARKLESALNAAREAIAFALTKEEGDMSDAEQCGGWDDIDWINAHARANRYRTALAQIDEALSPQQSKTT